MSLSDELRSVGNQEQGRKDDDDDDDDDDGDTVVTIKPVGRTKMKVDTSACLSSLLNCVNNSFLESNNAVDKTEIHSLVRPPASSP